MKALNSILISLLVCSFVCVLGCSSSTDPVQKNGNEITSGSSPTLELLQVSDCKQNTTGIPSVSAQSDIDCIEYWYSNGNLRMKHVNAGFNCCPELDFAVHIEGTNIIIEEIEIEGLCSCLCLFDVMYEIQDLAPGAYHLLVIEPYLPDGDPVLELDMDLLNTPAGNYCVNRTQYPWRY